MKILYDNEIFGLQSVGGASNYFANLITRLQESGNQIIFPHLYTNNIYIKDINCTNFPQAKFFLSKYYYRLINNKFSKKIIYSGQYDIFHHTYYDTYFLDKFKKSSRLVITIHDMVHERYPELNKFGKIITNNKKKLVARADKIIVISQKTKDDLCKFFSVDEKKISIIYHGRNFDEISIKHPPLNYLPDEYLLFVGTRSGYKNFDWMVKNLAKTLLSRNITLVCIGSPFTSQELGLINYLGIPRLVKHCLVKDTVTLQNIYANAQIFIYPSLYEGFGMPILEAYAAKVPVLLTNASCFPEIAGSGAMYFQPHDPDDFSNKVNLILDSKDLSLKLTNAGLSRLKDFSWAKCVTETAKAYQEIM